VAQLASVAGDQLARIALTVLVYARTASALLAAVTFVASVLPMFVGGVTLGGLADRFPRRTVMIACDLVRAALVLLMVVRGVPVAALVVLLVAVTLASGPFTAARSATLPDVLDGERYVLGQTVTLTTSQFAQVIGFGVGGVVVGFLGTGPSLVIDAATYALSAVIVRTWVRRRELPRLAPSASSPSPPLSSSSLPSASALSSPDSGAAVVPGSGAVASAVAPGSASAVVPRSGDAEADGGLWGAVRVVFGTRALRLPMFFGWLACFYNAPEGVAAPLAGSLHGDAASVGVILAAQVLGETFGMLVVGRFMPPAVRRRWMGPLAIATCAVLMLFAARPGLGAAVAVLAASGAFGGYQPAASAAFVSAVPMSMRGAAFGIAQGGMSLAQGMAMIAAGAAAGVFTASDVIAAVGAIGAVCAAGVAISWGRTPRSA
jgi:MFS family permease